MDLNNSTSIRLLVVLILSAVCCCWPAPTVAQQPPEKDLASGFTLENDTAPAVGYRKSFALVIGINYHDPTRPVEDLIALPELKNAENDAKAFAKLLKTHYGYTDENLVVLLHEEATHQRIMDALGEFADPAKVSEGDSVLVYFAGHGTRIDGKANERGAIYPFDVRLSGGRPLNRHIRLHSDLLNSLKKSDARHKLLLLDSCFSGEIFNIAARPRSEVDDRGQKDLFSYSAIQAIASCRATQVASDGTGEHSPFTNSLLNGLQRLPARNVRGAGSRVWTNQLFRYMRSELNTGQAAQNPDCRNLTGDGEFHFFPKGDFSRFKGKDHDFKVLQAMVPGEHGFWWFEEIPWFIPSVRRAVLANTETHRSNIESLVISHDALRRLAEDEALRLKDSQVPLDKMRVRHLEMLLNRQAADNFMTIMESIATDLESDKEQLEPTDLHFLAVLQHALGQEEANSTYRMALLAYVAEGDTYNALRALCLADYAFFLMKGSPKAAAERFRQADSVFGIQAPASFRIYILCQEASAWLRLKNWGEANSRLLIARDLATNFDAMHALTAEVHRRRAWAQMIQWRVNEAAESFQKSNEILHSVMSSTVQSDESESIAEHDADDLPITHDYTSLVAYLHNLHGLAMTIRYKGDSDEAARQYRGLVRMIMAVRSRLKQSATATVDSKTDDRVLRRLINTQERLADCNLFGDPVTRDLKESLDDYRRALSLCHDLGGDRDRIRASLLFKKALALSCSGSPVQDTELATYTCQEAAKLTRELGTAATDTLLSYETLVSNIVLVEHATKKKHRTIGTSSRGVDSSGQASSLNDPAADDPIKQLRNAILELRDEIGTNVQRDQLELLLYATRVLLNHSEDSNRYFLNEDSELLLSFCRHTLVPYDNRSGLNRYKVQDARAFLRPYYDTVMRRKILQGENTNIKDLLEVQWQATHGQYYVKPKIEMPVIALYLLDEECILMFDLPRGASRFYELSKLENISLEEIRAACEAGSQKLLLPREVTRELTRWRTTHGENASLTIDCLWQDHKLLDIQPDVESFVGSEDGASEFIGQFPLELPKGFVMHAASEKTASANPQLGLNN